MNSKTTISTSPFVWVEIYVQDMPRAKTFYQAVFGWQLNKLETGTNDNGIEMWAFPRPEGGPGAGGALVKMEGCPSGGNSTIAYFSCTDCTQEAQRVSQNGGRIFKDKFSIGPYGFIALVVDTEGNMIGLHSLA